MHVCFRSDYIPYDVTNRPVRPHQEYEPKPGHIELGTTYNRDFNAHKIEPVGPARPVENRQINMGKFDTNPTYKGKLINLGLVTVSGYLYMHQSLAGSGSADFSPCMGRLVVQKSIYRLDVPYLISATCYSRQW